MGFQNFDLVFDFLCIFILLTSIQNLLFLLQLNNLLRPFQFMVELLWHIGFNKFYFLSLPILHILNKLHCFFLILIHILVPCELELFILVILLLFYPLYLFLLSCYHIVHLPLLFLVLPVFRDNFQLVSQNIVLLSFTLLFYVGNHFD
jgi:hypothetical protein